MAEWLVEDGIGECRAALIDGGALMEMAMAWPEDPGPRGGAILPARLVRRADATGRGLARLEDGEEVQLAPVPSAATEGMALCIEIVRERLPEAGGWKPARARLAAPGAALADGPDLLARLRSAAAPVRMLRRGETLDGFGWSEAVEEASCGIVARPDVLLRISPTPAMTLIDVDGTTAAAELAVAGARGAGQAIRRFGIAGSIGIDLPTLEGKADRQATAAALDGALPQPFERTAVNGFGFLQIVRRRTRQSIVERLQADPVGAAARALLRAAERAGGAGDVRLAAHPRVIDRLAAHGAWLEALRRRLGTGLSLQADAALAISAGHASRPHP